MKITYTKEFLRAAKSLKKKFPKIDSDLSFANEQLKFGKISGDLMQGFSGYGIYKLRVRNSSSNSGKSGGFRVVYYLESSEKMIYMLTIYSKTEQENVACSEILEILQQENL